MLLIVINFIQIDEQYKNTRYNCIKISTKLRLKILKTKDDDLTQILNLLKNLKQKKTNSIDESYYIYLQRLVVRFEL